MWQQANGLSCNPKQAVSPQLLIRLVDCGVCDSVQYPSLLPLFCDLSLPTTAITAHWTKTDDSSHSITFMFESPSTLT